MSDDKSAWVIKAWHDAAQAAERSIAEDQSCDLHSLRCAGDELVARIELLVRNGQRRERLLGERSADARLTAEEHAVLRRTQERMSKPERGPADAKLVADMYERLDGTRIEPSPAAPSPDDGYPPGYSRQPQEGARGDAPDVAALRERWESALREYARVNAGAVMTPEDAGLRKAGHALLAALEMANTARAENQPAHLLGRTLRCPVCGQFTIYRAVEAAEAQPAAVSAEAVEAAIQAWHGSEACADSTRRFNARYGRYSGEDTNRSAQAAYDYAMSLFIAARLAPPAGGTPE